VDPLVKRRRRDANRASDPNTREPIGPDETVCRGAANAEKALNLIDRHERFRDPDRVDTSILHATTPFEAR
jgi:hypothetical protein